MYERECGELASQLLQRALMLEQCFNRASAANLGINRFIQRAKKFEQPSLMRLNTRNRASLADLIVIGTRVIPIKVKI